MLFNVLMSVDIYYNCSFRLLKVYFKLLSILLLLLLHRFIRSWW